ncbi:hypothetical protein BKA63DRAFT_319001 [Paraphoma chrysanthemicola]|nr:hypothetical protein BKA63DRAFT_319001 [Paraphoma chrysanthemicola]
MEGSGHQVIIYPMLDCAHCTSIVVRADPLYHRCRLLWQLAVVAVAREDVGSAAAKGIIQTYAGVRSGEIHCPGDRAIPQAGTIVSQSLAKCYGCSRAAHGHEFARLCRLPRRSQQPEGFEDVRKTRASLNLCEDISGRRLVVRQRDAMRVVGGGWGVCVDGLDEEGAQEAKEGNCGNTESPPTMCMARTTTTAGVSPSMSLAA